MTSLAVSVVDDDIEHCHRPQQFIACVDHVDDTLIGLGFNVALDGAWTEWAAGHDCFGNEGEGKRPIDTVGPHLANCQRRCIEVPQGPRPGYGLVYDPDTVGCLSKECRVGCLNKSAFDGLDNRTPLTVGDCGGLRWLWDRRALLDPSRGRTQDRPAYRRPPRMRPVSLPP